MATSEALFAAHQNFLILVKLYEIKHGIVSLVKRGLKPCTQIKISKAWTAFFIRHGLDYKNIIIRTLLK